MSNWYVVSNAEPYIKLGGNGAVKQNVTHVMQFPVITEEQAKKIDEEIYNHISMHPSYRDVNPYTSFYCVCVYEFSQQSN